MSKFYIFAFSGMVLALFLAPRAVCDGSVSSESGTGLLKKREIAFEDHEKKALSFAATLIKITNGAPVVIGHYQALHRSLQEVVALKAPATKGAVAADEGKGDEDAKEFETANERVMCKEIVARLRKSMPASVFKTAHMQGKRFHSTLHKIIHAEFQDKDPSFKSWVMQFMKLPADQLDGRMEHFFSEISTPDSLKQFLKELLTVLEGMKAHLPGGEKMLEKLVPPTAEELVNAPAASGKK